MSPTESCLVEARLCPECGTSSTCLLQGRKAGGICALSCNLELRKENSEVFEADIRGRSWGGQTKRRHKKANEVERKWEKNPTQRRCLNVLIPPVCTCFHACALGVYVFIPGLTRSVHAYLGLCWPYMTHR